MIDNIPSFVLRGLSRRQSPTIADDCAMSYRNEADLRDAVAATWWLAGWDVKTEHRVPDCGRIDVLAQAGTTCVVIEVKQRLGSATEARQAFQQAHAYVSYLGHSPTTIGQVIHGYVTAAEIEMPAVLSARRAYRETVTDVEFWDAMCRLPQMLAFASKSTTHQTMAAATARRESLAVLTSAARSVEVAHVLANESLGQVSA